MHVSSVAGENADLQRKLKALRNEMDIQRKEHLSKGRVSLTTMSISIIDTSWK